MELYGNNNLTEVEEPHRPPHFRESPNERTIAYPPADYPSAEELEGYDEEPLRVAVDTAPKQRREDIHWSANRFFVDDARHVQLAGYDRTRRRLLLRNNSDANPVYLVRDATSPAWTGYELPTGGTLELWHNDAVWAICETGESANVSVVSEFIPQE